MIIPEEISVGNVLDYLTEDHGWQPSVMGWQDIKWLNEDPEGFNAVHRPREITEVESLSNDIEDLPITIQIGERNFIQINHVHRLQNLHFLLTKKPLPWKTL